MNYRLLGKTGLEIPEIVFGCGAVGGVIFKPEWEETVRAVTRALEQGINWFDTAPVYGNTKSEENLGLLFRELAVSPHVSTKVMLGPEQLGDIRGAIRRSMEASLERLQLDRVDLIQLHNGITRDQRGARQNSLTLEDVLGKGGVAEAFEALISDGLASFAGFTAVGDPECLDQMVRSGRFHSIQSYYNLLNPSPGYEVGKGFYGTDYRRLIGTAEECGVGVLAIRALSGGILAGRPMEDAMWAMQSVEEPEQGRALLEALREVVGEEPEDLYQAAIRFVLGTPGVSGSLIGFSSRDHVDAAVEAMERGPLPDETLHRLKELYRKPPFCSP